MASGEKLPNTNLNLIQDTDMIDYADINAIAQAVETNSANIGLLGPSTLPISTGTGTVRYGRFGGLGWVEIDWTATEASPLGTPTNVAQYLPVGCRPAFTTPFLGRSFTTTNNPSSAHFIVSAGGWVGINQGSSVAVGERLQGSVVFPVS